MYQLKHIKHTEIDFSKWDQTILASQYPLVFAQSFYLDATFPNWEAIIIGDYDCVFPITKKNKFGVSYLHQPSFTPQLGLFGKVNSEIEKKVYDYLVAHFKLVEIELNASNQLLTKHHSNKTTYIIDYCKEFKQNQNTKRNINKAKENKLIVEQITENEVLELSKIHLNPFLSKQLHLSGGTISVFNNLLQSCMSHKTLFSFKVIDDQKNVKALAHFICNGKHTVYLKGTNFDKSENSGSMHLLTHFAIEFFKDKAQWFDFGGGTKESLANFYKGFGGEALNYQVLKINNLPLVIKLLRKLK